MKYIFLPHTADVKFQAFGNNLEEVFENSGYALINIICKEKVKGKIKKTIKVSGKDRERLLYNFLEELLYILDVGDFLTGEIKELKIIGIPQKKGDKTYYNFHLTCIVYGDNVKNYETEGDVKAVTYNDMWIKQEKVDEKNKFICQVVVDV